MSGERAAVILLQDDHLALLERHRDGRHYYVFPGGHIEPGETAAQAAVREAEEELGVQVAIRRLVAEDEVNGRRHYYFLADLAGGTFGTGTGEEWNSPPADKGTYAAVWLPVRDLLTFPVKPFSMAEHVVRYHRAGWPEALLSVPG